DAARDGDELDVVSPAPGLDRGPADAADGLLDERGAGATGEYHFGVPAGEPGAGARRGGGEQHRGPLPARRRQVRALDLEVLPVMVDRADPGRVREDVVLPVRDDRVVVPRAFPELVEDIEVLVRDLEPGVVLYLAV